LCSATERYRLGAPSCIFFGVLNHPPLAKAQQPHVGAGLAEAPGASSKASQGEHSGSGSGFI